MPLYDKDHKLVVDDKAVRRFERYVLAWWQPLNWWRYECWRPEVLLIPRLESFDAMTGRPLKVGTVIRINLWRGDPDRVEEPPYPYAPAKLVWFTRINTNLKWLSK